MAEGQLHGGGSGGRQHDVSFTTRTAAVDSTETDGIPSVESFEQLGVGASADEVDGAAGIRRIIDLVDHKEVPADMAFPVIRPAPFSAWSLRGGRVLLLAAGFFKLREHLVSAGSARIRRGGCPTYSRGYPAPKASTG